VAYAIVFKKEIRPDAPSIEGEPEYINECCRGGDVVAERLRAALVEAFENVALGQEDWGWYVEARRGDVRLWLRVYQHAEAGDEWLVNIETRRARPWLGVLGLTYLVDTPELEEAKRIVVSRLDGWIVGTCEVEASTVD
jgi:hypothetical protein